MEELIAIFKNFLQENHCLESYIQNMRNYNPQTTHIAAPGSLIIRAFNWANTKEGHSYWSNRHSRWLELTINNNYYTISREDLISQLEDTDNLWED